MSAQTEEQSYAYEGGIGSMEDFPTSEGEEIQDDEEQEVDDIQEEQIDDIQDDEKSVEEETSGDDEPVVEDSSQREELLFRAAKMNLPMERILAFRDTDSLRTVVEMQEQLREESGSDAPVDVSEPPEWYALPEGFEDKVDPEAVEILRGMNEGVKGAVEQFVDYKVASKESALRAELDGILNETSAERGAQFDEALQSLGKDWEKVFGAGYLDEVRQGSEQYNNRTKVFNHMMSSGMKGSIAKRAVAAAKALFPENVEKLAKQSNVKKARDRQGKFIGRGAERTKMPGEISPRDRLKQALTEQGFDMSDDDMGELDNFPDAG